MQSEVLAALIAAPDYVNPAIALSVELLRAETLGKHDVLERAISSGDVERAVVAGEKEGRAVMMAMSDCGYMPPIAGKTVPVGF